MPRCVLVAPALAVFVVVAGSACSWFGTGYEPGPSPAREPPARPLVAIGNVGLRVIYPPTDGTTASVGQSIVVTARDDYQIQSVDSTFVFGTAGTGDANVRVNGRAVPVYPTGGWIAWVPLDRDSVATFDIVAVARDDSAHLVLHAPVSTRFTPPNSAVWIDTTSLSPRGDRWTRPDEGLRLSLLAARGATVHLRLPDGRTIPLRGRHPAADVPWGARAFATTAPTDGFRRPEADRYEAWWAGPLGPDPGHVLFPDSLPADDDTLWVSVEAARGPDTARVRWPLRLGVVEPGPWPVVVVDDDTAGTGLTDSTLAGRPAPYGTYHWFFSNGTRSAVSGRWNGQMRLQLSSASVAWVDATDVVPAQRGTPPLRGTTSSIRLIPGDDALRLRVPLPGQIPFRIDEAEDQLRLTLYGVAANMDWIQYGGTDDLVRLVSFAQPREDEAQVIVDLTEPVWGYRTTWQGNDLLLDIRRPPTIDPGRPLSGRVVAIDPGHPPGGATGPTGLKEPEVVLAVARKVAQLLERFGARPVLTRETDQPIDLTARVKTAERAGAEVLVSIHANALPDGVNPFVNNGTSVYYFHPRSARLARDLNRALVRQFGFRDLGMGRGDLALARPTWMPAALTEGLFMMIPEQEAVLGSEDGQWRYARGIVDGLAAFLRSHATRKRSM